MMIPVKGHSNLYRDEHSGAIINCDNSEYNQYINMKKNRDLYEYEIQEMKKDINEIKTLLREFLNGSK